MQKVFISLLFICLFVVAPSFVQAAELVQPASSSDTTTANSSSLQQDSSTQSEITNILSNLSELSNILTTDVQGTLQNVVSSDSNVSSNLQVSSDSLKSDTNAQVSDQPVVQVLETNIIVDNQGTINASQTSEVSREQTASVENNNVSESAELPAVQQNKVSNPLLSVNLLGISVDVLGDSNQGTSFTDGSLLSINTNSLTNVDLSITSTLGTSGGLLGADLGLPIIGDVNLDLLSGTTNGSVRSENLLTQGGLLGLGITDSTLLGNVNLGLLPGNLQNEYNFSGGLVITNPKSEDKTKLGEDSIFVDPIMWINPIKPIYVGDIISSPIGTQIKELKQVDESHILGKKEITLTDAANKMVLNPKIAKDSDELKHVIDRVNEKAIQSESVLPSSGSSFSGSSSGTGANGSSASNAGSGVAAYLNSEYITEVALNNQAQYIVNKLSDQWQLRPKIEPPKSFFFLNN